MSLVSWPFKKDTRSLPDTLSADTPSSPSRRQYQGGGLLGSIIVSFSLMGLWVLSSFAPNAVILVQVLTSRWLGPWSMGFSVECRHAVRHTASVDIFHH